VAGTYNFLVIRTSDVLRRTYYVGRTTSDVQPNFYTNSTTTREGIVTAVGVSDTQRYPEKITGVPNGVDSNGVEGLGFLDIVPTLYDKDADVHSDKNIWEAVVGVAPLVEKSDTRKKFHSVPSTYHILIRNAVICESMFQPPGKAASHDDSTGAQNESGTTNEQSDHDEGNSSSQTSPNKKKRTKSPPSGSISQKSASVPAMVSSPPRTVTVTKSGREVTGNQFFKNS